MKTQRIVAVIVALIGVYLLTDAIGEYGAADNKSENWLGGIFVMVGLWLGLTDKRIL